MQWRQGGAGAGLVHVGAGVEEGLDDRGAPEAARRARANASYARPPSYPHAPKGLDAHRLRGDGGRPERE